MQHAWDHQIRAYLTAAAADALRSGRTDQALVPLLDTLRAHRATAVSQLEAFEAYVADAQASPEAFPLYRWTKATLEDPAKRARHALAFALRIDGAEVYAPALADALERDLHPLVGGGVVTRLSRHSTDPSTNLQIPAEYRP